MNKTLRKKLDSAVAKLKAIQAVIESAADKERDYSHELATDALDGAEVAIQDAIDNIKLAQSA